MAEIAETASKDEHKHPKETDKSVRRFYLCFRDLRSDSCWKQWLFIRLQSIAAIVKQLPDYITVSEAILNLDKQNNMSMQSLLFQIKRHVFPHAHSECRSWEVIHYK